MPAKSGHSSVIAIELDDGAGAVVSGTFAVVAGFTTEIGITKTRNSEDGSAFGDTISSTIVSDLLRMGPITITGNFLIASAANQDATTGLEKHMHTNNIFGLEFRGPDYVLDTADHIRMFGQLSAFTRKAGFDQAKYMFEMTFNPSGPITQDGGTIGTTLQP